MKKTNNVIWGVVLVAIGVIFALNALEITDIKIFFKGWWTLFIIVPCTIGLFTGRDRTGNLIGLLIGVFLLLSVNKIIEFSMLWKLGIPAIIVIIGVRMIWNSVIGNKTFQTIDREMKEKGTGLKYGTATFSNQNLNFDGEVFEAAELNAIFGGVKCNLRNAKFEKDAIIDASAIFGGIEIYVPDNINVKVISNSLFGGVSNKRAWVYNEGAHTLYVKATCIFGGVDIK